ncbi:MAG: DUF488 domain-containing protein [Thermoleophilia bacterium]
MLLNALGGEIGNLDFQKLLLLYCVEIAETPIYEFIPYKYGAFSFTSYADKRRLIERGLLHNKDLTWKLTAAGRAVSVDASTVAAMNKFAKRHEGLRGDNLVAETYRRYPYYAIRSEIADRVLAGDSAASKAIAANRPNTNGSGLFTIGYEGRTLEGYLNLLIRKGVTVLCDVRRNPISRKYGFSKSTLLKACEGVGIKYKHLPELGIASKDRRDLKTQSDFDALFAVYARDSLPKQMKSLMKIAYWIDKGERVTLTCYERIPEQCHRICVAEILEQKFGNTFAPKHL